MHVLMCCFTNHVSLWVTKGCDLSTLPSCFFDTQTSYPLHSVFYWIRTLLLSYHFFLHVSWLWACSLASRFGMCARSKWSLTACWTV